MPHRIFLAVLSILSICGAHTDTAAEETLRITNEAVGVACYTTGDLLSAHGAIGFYNLAKVQALIIEDRCFIMGEHWRVLLLDRQRIMGADVDMLNVRLALGNESRRVWSLKKNFESMFGPE